MQSPNDALVHVLKISQTMLTRYTQDLEPDEYLHRPTEKSNCAAWLIGHLTLTERMGLRLLRGELPPLPEGFEKRFSRDEGCPQAHEFGDAPGLMGLFNEHRNRLIDAVRRATPEQLAKPLDKPIGVNIATTVGEAMNFIAIHVMMHAGQITIIRRSLGRPPLV
jgi:uncharacterized damage-inducible protein DinB